MSTKERLESLAEFSPLVETKKRFVIDADIDAYGDHLHHTGPLKLFEQERIRVFEESGMPIEQMAEERGLWGFVREISIKYISQIQRGDNITVTTKVFHLRPTLLAFHQTISNAEGKKMVEAVVDGAFVNKDGKPVGVPQDVAENLRKNRVEIVRVDPADWQILRDLKLESVLEEPIAFEDQQEGLDKYRERTDAEWVNKLEDILYLFAKQGEAYIGMVSAIPDSDDENKFEIQHLYVDSNLRGSGVGERLMISIIQDLEEIRVKTVKLCVLESQNPAIKLYTKLGFRRVGQCEVKRGDETYTEYVMEKELWPFGFDFN